MTKPELRYFAFDPFQLLKASVDAFVRSQDSLPDLARAIVSAMMAMELSLKRELAEHCPALILSNIDDDGKNVVKVFDLESRIPNSEFRDLKTAKFETLLKRISHFRDTSQHDHALNELYRMRNALVHHEVHFDMAKVNYYLMASAYPFLKDLLVSRPGKQYFASNRWRRIERLRDKKSDEYSLALHKLLALHAEKLDSSNALQRTFIRRIKSRTLEWLDESIRADNLYCPACQEPTGACFSGYEPGEGPDGEMTYPYEVFRCRFCELNLDPTQVQYLSEHLGDFELEHKSAEIKQILVGMNYESAAEAFRDIST